VPDFAAFDRRHYRTVGVPEGYAAWASTYEATVEDAMDLALLDRLETVEWSKVRRAADLGCGTGRTARWLRTRGDFPIDGVDVTPAMLELARAKGLHNRLVVADVRATGLESGAYDLVTCVLVDEHLPDLRPLYLEARRLLRPGLGGGDVVMVGVHPYFLMAVGMPTHFDDPEGEPVAIETHLHLPSEHVAAARAAGLVPHEMHEALVDDDLLRLKPGWEAHRGVPFSYAWVHRTDGTPADCS
jgi:SAM-dependent methyltransferase